MRREGELYLSVPLLFDANRAFFFQNFCFVSVWNSAEFNFS